MTEKIIEGNKENTVNYWMAEQQIFEFFFLEMFYNENTLLNFKTRKHYQSLLNHICVKYNGI